MQRIALINRLRVKITIGTALILGLFLFVLGMYIINSQRLQLVQNLSDHGNRIAALAARSSAEYIQRFSFFLMEDQALSIEQSPNIAFCEIYDAEGVSLLQSGNIISVDHEGKNRAEYGDNILVVTQEIVADGTILGLVEIGLKLDSIEKALREKTSHLILLFFGFTLCVILVLNLFFHKLFIRPVQNLTNGAQRVANRDFVTIDVGSRKDEIGLLATNFNIMSRNLQGLYINLEDQVQERTQALEQANADLLIAIEQAKGMAQKAEEGTVAKSQFLASMSHEIRTPMNAVLGMSEILNESNLDDEQRRYVRVLLESGNALLNLIDDILDLSKIEAGEMVYEHMPFNLESVVDKSFKVTAFAGHQKGLDLDYSIASDVPVELHGDSVRLQQILINLIGNGIKFTDTGSVFIDISIDSAKVPSSTDMVMVKFCVHDSGIGIEADKLKNIFDNFTQADASTTRRYGGTGLGLSICQLLCRELGGNIWIESELDKGASVNFCLPYQVLDASDKPHSRLRGMTLLLLDEREYTKYALASRLERVGARVDIVTNYGAQASNLVTPGPLSIYDAVVICMPRDKNFWWDAVSWLKIGRAHV